MEFSNYRLRDKLAIEKTYSNSVMGMFLKKNWEYDKFNNNFTKNNIIAYFYFNIIFFHFNTNIATSKFNPFHSIKLWEENN